MIKRFLKDSFTYGIGGILTKGINLILLPVYVRVLMPEDYGVIDFLLVFFTLIGVFFSLEIYQAIARYFHEFEDKEERIKSISTAFLFISVSYLIFLSLIIIFSKQIAFFFFDEYSKDGLPTTISLAGIATYFGVLYSFCGNILRFSLRAKTFTVCSISNSLLTIILSIFFVVYLKIGIIGVFIGQLLGNILALIIAFYNIRDNFSFVFDIQKLKILLKYSLPLVPSSIGSFLLAYLDRIIIRYYLTISDLGIYGIANRFASITSLIMMSISMALTPLIYENYKKETTSGEIAVIFSFLSSIIIIFISGISLFSKEIIFIFTTPDYYAAASLFPFLFLAGFLSRMYDFVPGLSIAKKTKIIAFIYVIGAAITVLIDVLTIRKFGILAVACANLFSALFVFIINYLFSQRYYKINYNLKPIFAVCLISIVTISIGYLYFNEISLLNILYKTGIFLLIASLPFIFRIVDISYVKKLFNLIKLKA